MDLLEIETFEDAVAFVLERAEVDAQELHMIAMMFGLEADAKLRALMEERGIALVGGPAY
jgi:hypothetical protein